MDFAKISMLWAPTYLGSSDPNWKASSFQFGTSSKMGPIYTQTKGMFAYEYA